MDPQPEGSVIGDRWPDEEPFVVRSSPLRPLVSPVVAVLFVVGLGASTAVDFKYWISDLGEPAEDYLQRSILLVLQCAFLVWVLLISSPLLAPIRRRVVLALGPEGTWIATNHSQEPLIWLAWSTVSRIWLRRQALGWELRVQTNDPAAVRSVSLAFSNRGTEEIRAALAHYVPANTTTDVGR